MVARKFTSLAFGISLHTHSAFAQNLSYGADNFYRSNNVTMTPITFPNLYQMTVAGNLFVPDFLNERTNASAIIVGHPMGAVKEQSANLYATKMAEQGFVTIALDSSGVPVTANPATLSYQTYTWKASAPPSTT
jgi:fermentation-respiration switch protein FrsA (DUF1100 family)